MHDPLHVLLLLSDERPIGRVLEMLRRSGYDVRAGYAHTAPALLDALGRRRWDAVIAAGGDPLGPISAADAAVLLRARPAAPPLFALHPDPAAPDGQALLDAGVRAVVAPDALAPLGAALAHARAERCRRRTAAPPPRRPLAADVADHLPIGIYQTSPDGQFVYANAALAALLGAPSADVLVGQHVADAYGYPRQAFLDAMQRDGEVRDLETMWTRPDGRRVHTREQARAVRDAQGSVRFYEGTLERITHREAADRQAAAAGRRHALLTFRDAADQASDEPALYQALLRAAESVLALSYLAAFGAASEHEPAPALHAWSEAFDPTRDRAVLAALAHAATDSTTDSPTPLPASLAPFAQTHRLRSVLAFSISRLHGGPGQLVGLVPIGRRFSPAELDDARLLARLAGAALDGFQARRELHLRAERDRFVAETAETVLQISGHGLALDAQGRLAWRDEETAAWLSQAFPGATVSHLDAPTLLTVLHPSSRRPLLRAVLQARAGTPVSLVVRRAPAGQPAHGASTWFSLTLRVADDGALYLAARDVTTERREQAERLAALAAARHERHLLTRFLAHANHQLRTPLTSVLGFASVVAEETTGEAQDHARLIVDSSQALANHLALVLTLARPHPDDQTLHLAPADLSDAAKPTLDLMEPLARESGFRFDVSYPKRPVSAVLDPEALARLLYALVGAAVASPKSGRIRVEVAQRGGRATVTVAAPRIGEPGPDGLPELAALRTLAERMGGQLTLSARPGGLVTATLRLAAHPAGTPHEIEELLPPHEAPPDLAPLPLALDLPGLQTGEVPELPALVSEPAPFLPDLAEPPPLAPAPR